MFLSPSSEKQNETRGKKLGTRRAKRVLVILKKCEREIQFLPTFNYIVIKEEIKFHLLGFSATFLWLDRGVVFHFQHLPVNTLGQDAIWFCTMNAVCDPCRITSVQCRYVHCGTVFTSDWAIVRN